MSEVMPISMTVNGKAVEGNFLPAEALEAENDIVVVMG